MTGAREGEIYPSMFVSHYGERHLFTPHPRREDSCVSPSIALTSSVYLQLPKETECVKDTDGESYLFLSWSEGIKTDLPPSMISLSRDKQDENNTSFLHLSVSIFHSRERDLFPLSPRKEDRSD